MPEISVVIITYNEEKNISRCLESVREVADEILVVDSFSTDNTEAICRKFGVKFIRHAFFGYIEQKNWAVSQAKYPHVLSIDADEALSPQLKDNILKVKANWTHDGYYFNRITSYCGKWMKHGSWYPDRKLRLWDSRKGAWRGINPHDRFELYRGGKTRFLKGDLLHYSYYTREEHARQMFRFSEILGMAYFKSGRKAGILKPLLNPAWRFFRDYFVKMGFLDGKAGWHVALMAARETHLKYSRLRQLTGAMNTAGLNTICFFNGTPSWGGGEKWHYDISGKLAEKGYQVLVITGWKSQLSKRIRSSGISSLEIGVSNFSFLNPVKMRRLYRIFRNQGVRSVIINRSTDLKLAGPAARLAGVDKIIYRRGSAIPVRNSLLNQWLFSRILTQVIANSEETRRTLLLRNPALIEQSRIHVIYNGIDLQKVDESPVGESYRRDGVLMLGNAGRLSYEKGQQYLIELAEMLKKKGVSFRLLIAGTGEMGNRLKTRAREAGVEDQVEFLGFVEDMKKFYRSIDIFLLTSLWEGFGYVLVEAMANRVPVITCDIGSSWEIVKDGQTGYIIPGRDMEYMADKIQELSVNPQRIKQMGQAGRKWVEETFDITIGVRQVEALLLSD